MNLGSNRKPILIVIVILVIVGIVVVYLALRGKGPATQLFKKGPKVELQSTYKNPFNKDTQFVNPFEKYKNPFVTNR